MTKFQLMLTSLVAVIPGAFLCIVLAMAVMSYTMPAMAYAMVGLTLAAAAVTVLMPLGIVIGGGRSAAAAAQPAAKKSVSEEVAAIDEEVEIDDMSAESVEAPVVEDDLEFSESEFELGSETEEENFLQTEAEVETEPMEDFENFEMDSEADDLDEFKLDFDDEEDDDEPKSKKKKKR